MKKACFFAGAQAETEEAEDEAVAVEEEGAVEVGTSAEGDISARDLFVDFETGIDTN
jgi:hypothetical protein